MPTTPTPATLYAALADALSGLAVAREELTAAYNDTFDAHADRVLVDAQVRMRNALKRVTSAFFAAMSCSRGDQRAHLTSEQEVVAYVDASALRRAADDYASLARALARGVVS